MPPFRLHSPPNYEIDIVIEAEDFDQARQQLSQQLGLSGTALTRFQDTIRVQRLTDSNTLLRDTHDALDEWPNPLTRFVAHKMKAQFSSPQHSEFRNTVTRIFRNALAESLHGSGSNPSAIAVKNLNTYFWDNLSKIREQLLAFPASKKYKPTNSPLSDDANEFLDAALAGVNWFVAADFVMAWCLTGYQPHPDGTYAALAAAGKLGAPQKGFQRHVDEDEEDYDPADEDPE